MGIPYLTKIVKNEELEYSPNVKYNVSVDISSFFFYPPHTQENVLNSLANLFNRINISEIFLACDGIQPKQKAGEQNWRRFKNFLNYTMTTDHGMKRAMVLKTEILTTAKEFINLLGKLLQNNVDTILYDFSEPGEGEMKAVVFNKFTDPKLPKLVYANDNDVILLQLSEPSILGKDDYKYWQKKNGSYFYEPHDWEKIVFKDQKVYIQTIKPNLQRCWQTVFLFIIFGGNDYLTGTYSNPGHEKLNKFFNFLKQFNFSSKEPNWKEAGLLLEKYIQDFNIKCETVNEALKKNKERLLPDFVRMLKWVTSYYYWRPVCFEEDSKFPNGILINEVIPKLYDNVKIFYPDTVKILQNE